MALAPVSSLVKNSSDRGRVCAAAVPMSAADVLYVTSGATELLKCSDPERRDATALAIQRRSGVPQIWHIIQRELNPPGRLLLLLQSAVGSLTQ